MDLYTLIYSLPPIVTAVLGWLWGKRKQRNDTLQEMQDSIDKLVTENNRLLKDVVDVKVANANFQVEIANLKLQNNELECKIAKLSNKIKTAKPKK